MHLYRAEKFKHDLKTALDICKKQEEIEKIRTSQAHYLFE